MPARRSTSPSRTTPPDLATTDLDDEDGGWVTEIAVDVARSSTRLTPVGGARVGSVSHPPSSIVGEGGGEMTQQTQQYATAAERLLADAEAEVAGRVEAGEMTADQAAVYLEQVAGGLAFTEQRADNTVDAYARSWAQFEAFCAKAGVEALPASPTAVLAFFEWLRERGKLALVDGKWEPTGQPLHPSTIGSYVAAIASKHVETLAPDPFTDPALRGVVGAWAKKVRKKSDNPEKSSGLLRDQLRQVVAGFDTPDPVTVRDRALAALTDADPACSPAFLASLVAWDQAVEWLPGGGVRLIGRSSKGNRKVVELPDPDATVRLRAWFKINPAGPIWPGNKTAERAAAGAAAALSDRAIPAAAARGRAAAAAGVDTAGPEAARNAAAICLGWWAALRASEAAAITFGDVTPTPYLDSAGQPRIGLTVLIGSSKTDQEGGGVEVALPERPDDPGICPRRRWEAWVEQARVLLGLAPGEPIPANTPAFFRLNRGALNGGEAKAMAPQAFSPMLRTAAQAVLGKPDARPLGTAVHRRLSWHGLRRGFATEATNDGVAITRVAQHGRWKNTATVGLYNVTTNPLAFGAAAQMPAADPVPATVEAEALAAENAALRAELEALRHQNGR